jgi:hypothetical protein
MLITLSVIQGLNQQEFDLFGYNVKFYFFGDRIWCELNDDDTEPLNVPTELLAEELYTVIVPLIEDDTLFKSANEEDADELINKIVPPILVFPPLNVADCVTATGT